MQNNALPTLPGIPAPQRAICGVPGCGVKLNIDNATGFCRPHRHPTSRTAPRICGVDGCERQLLARNTTGFCFAHCNHTPNAAKRKAEERAQAEARRLQWPTCAADGCTKKLRKDNKSGRCYKHRHVPVSPADRGQCSVEGCGRMLSPKNTLGRCIEHSLPRWVAAECAAEGCTKKLNVTNLTGLCGQHTNGYRRDHVLRRDYGITEAEYDAMLAAQNGLCALCGKPPKPGGKGTASRLNVDHDHETGRVRALLCTNCNRGIGFFKDNPTLMRRAAAYVTRYRAEQPPVPDLTPADSLF
jgi:Recombination endonuclease VII